MPTKLVRRGSVQGYRPTREQLEQILKLAQIDIDNDPIVRLAYSKGNEEIFSEGSNGKILPENLAQLIIDGINPDELNDLYFSITQASPPRRIEIEIGPGNWTRYLIESDDRTWAHGRYHEITEKLFANRSLYAKSHSPAPQVPKEGTGGWRPAAWEPVSDWRIAVVDYIIPSLWTALILEILVFLVAAGYYSEKDINTAARNDIHRVTSRRVVYEKATSRSVSI